jgi:hypothetical protein
VERGKRLIGLTMIDIDRGCSFVDKTREIISWLLENTSVTTGEVDRNTTLVGFQQLVHRFISLIFVMLFCCFSCYYLILGKEDKLAEIDFRGEEVEEIEKKEERRSGKEEKEKEKEKEAESSEETMKSESEEIDVYEIEVGRKGKHKVCIGGDRRVGEVKDIICEREWNEKMIEIRSCGRGRGRRRGGGGGRI